MGSKNRYLIFLSLILAIPLKAQEGKDFPTIDSVTYRLWLDGDWDRLIREGGSAIRSGVDYKFIRQRVGHAYFEKGDYPRAEKHLSKVFEYDSFNGFTNEYLYFTYLNLGKEEYAGVLVDRIAPDIRDKYGISTARLIDKIDLEFNYKRTSTTLRSDASYYRIGLGTTASPRVGIYQAFSGFRQTINNNVTGDTTAFRIRQPEYYLLLNWNVSRRLMIRTAWHYIHTLTGYSMSRGNLYHLAVAPDFGRFGFEVNGSVTNTAGFYLYQAGLDMKYIFPGNSGFYLKGTVALLASEGGSRFVMGPATGIRLWKGSLLEGSLVAGELQGYNDFNGMYVYNSYDPMIRRTGVTLYQFMRTGTVIWLNYSIEKKEYSERRSFTYNQFSFLGGIRWKI